MPRGRRDGSLTGGTGDVNPQYMNLYTPSTGTGTIITQSTATPIPRLPQRSGRATVMEMFKVFFSTNQATPALTNADFVLFLLCTKNPGVTVPANALGDSSVIAAAQATVDFTTSGALIYEQPVAYDFTDGAGHGILIATDTLYLQFSNSSGASCAGQARIVYRFKEVGVEEYIGIVQSQS
jgi:hypothetical protein